MKKLLFLFSLLLCTVLSYAQNNQITTKAVVLSYRTAPPTPGSNRGVVYADISDGHIKWKDAAGTVYDLTTGGGGGGTWGSITGTLGDQTDLQGALDTKHDGSLTATRVPFATDANTLADDGTMFWNNTSKYLTIGDGTTNTTKLYINQSSGSTSSAGLVLQAAGVNKVHFSAGTSQSDLYCVNHSYRIFVNGTGNLSFLVAGSTGITYNASHATTGTHLFQTNGVTRLTIGNNNLVTTVPLGVGAADVLLNRISAGTLGLMNSTNAQELQIYNTDNGANDEGARLGFQENANAFTISSTATGTGVVRPIYITSGAADTRITKLAGSGSRMVVADAEGDLSTQAIPGGGSSGIDDVLALAQSLTTDRSITADANTLTMTFNGLTNDNGLHITSNATGGTSTTQRLIHAELSGAHSASTVASAAIRGFNSHTGITSTNYGVVGSASGGTFNYGVAGDGTVGVIGTGIIGVAGTSSVASGVGGQFSNTASSGTSTGLTATAIGAATTNIGGKFSATGGTNNYAIIVEPSNGNVGIGTATPSTKAILDLTSTTQGLLPPRMTTTQRNAISSPAEGLVVFDTDLNSLHQYTGSTWQSLSGGSAPNYSVQTLTDGATITWDTSLGINAQVTLGAAGRTLDMTNLTAGYTYTLRVIQDGTGSRTITTWETNTKWPFGGTVPTMSSGANQYDVYTFYYDGTNLYGGQAPNFQ